ncbi:MAG: hypothetical protein NDJ89_02900 [Oligoflexia bacterium]|nr:hypothetical protein [Oligoflexia bacterium]
MIQAAWSSLLRPPGKQSPEAYRAEWIPGYPSGVDAGIQVKPLDVDHQEVALPDGVSRRTLSRAGVLLALACRDARPVLEREASLDRFSIGAYCAMEPGPVDLHAARVMAAEPGADFARAYQANVNPKAYFHAMPSLPIAQVGIYLGILGRMTAFTHSSLGGQMALEQANRDLAAGRVRVAVVCGAFSLENPFVVLREARRSKPGTVLCEGAFCLVLRAPARLANLAPAEGRMERYGNIDTLMEMLIGGEHA